MLNNNLKSSPAGPVLEDTSRVRARRVKAAARCRWLFAGLFASLVFCPCVMAQEKHKPAAPAPLVTASATDERLRLVAPGSVVQLRLEVYGVSGQKVFDTEVRGGNVLDWHLRDGAGERLAAGSYTCLLTIKSLSGKLSQRAGLLAIGDKQTVMRPLKAAQLSAARRLFSTLIIKETLIVSGPGLTTTSTECLEPTGKMMTTNPSGRPPWNSPMAQS